MRFIPTPLVLPVSFLLLLGCMLACAPVVQAAPVWGEVHELKQPDGSLVQVKIWGDEFYQVVESLDGYTLVRHPDTGTICYAELSPDGDELVSTGIALQANAPEGLATGQHVRISKASARSKIQASRLRFDIGEQEVLNAAGVADGPQMAAPNNGNVQAICLIIDFPDEAGTIPASAVDSFCNQVGYTGYGNNGSIRDYFYDVSNGSLTYTNYVPAAYYTALYSKSYYDNPAEATGPKARALILEALNSLESSGFDFSQYDSNGDGLIDGINAFYAGNCNSGWAKGLWPHSWTVSFSADGVSTYKYQITDMGTSLEIGTFCHENGHMLCYWPDLYDYDYDSRGVGVFCIMCAGGHGTNPVEPCAYLKRDAGWADETVLAGSETGLSVTVGSNKVYTFRHPTKSYEYYLIENRRATGRDSQLTDSGIAIWHVDEYGSNDNQQMTPSLHYECTLVQADGNWDMENNLNYGDSTDLWGAPSYTECGPSTSPDTNWWAGDSSGLIVTNISSPDTTMTFDVGSGSLNYFECSTIASPQDVNVPFPVTITARDSGGGIADRFDGTASLSGIAGSGDVTIGSETASWNYPFSTFYEDARTQSIYLAGEIGGAGQINSLALDVATVPGQTMLNWTIRMKHIPSSFSSYGASPSWEGSGWTTVYQADEVIAGTGWKTFQFDTPFAYNGTDNLMIDFSFNNSSWSDDGYCRYSTTAGARSAYFRTDSYYGDPLSWLGTDPPVSTIARVPNITLSIGIPVAITPTVTGSFVDGVWTGNVTVLEPAVDVVLRIDDGSGHGGDSNSFEVIDTSPATADAGADSIGFESRGAAAYVCHLDGTGSTGASTYFWGQTAGLPVVLRGADTAAPDFDAPQWDGSTELSRTEASLVFSLTVNQGEPNESVDECGVYVRIPGDANGDDLVNAFDVALVRMVAPGSDFNGDETINAFDVVILRQNAGRRRTVD